MNIVLDVLRYLNEHGITLVRAAEATGVAQQNIKKSIGNNPKTSTLLALAKGLGVDPREFFYDLDGEEKEVEGSMQENLKLHLSEAADVTEEGADGQNGRGGLHSQITLRKQATASPPLPSVLTAGRGCAWGWCCCPSHKNKIPRQGSCACRGK